MSNYFRTDGWVKSSLGPAIPGTQIYVCTQPANIASAPPSPLAAIFSDPNGLVPITQPIITDGFGHYDFYTTPGVYTVIVGLGGIVQQVYPDQSIGGIGSGGGGTALALQANGQPLAYQLLLNLVGAGSVSVADQGNGTVNITGTSVELLTNGVQNTLQSKLNLVAGSGIVLTPDALGDVTVSSNVSGVTTVGYMMGAGSITPPYATLSGIAPSPDVANQVIVTRFGWAYSLTFNTISFTELGGTTANVAFGIYSGPTSLTPGVLLWSSGSIAVTNTTATLVVSVPSYTLAPGDYYLAMTCTSTSYTVYGVSLSEVTSAGTTSLFNGPPVGCGKAANASTNGPLTMPATLGTISIQAGSSTYGYPMIYFT